VSILIYFVHAFLTLRTVFLIPAVIFERPVAFLAELEIRTPISNIAGHRDGMILALEFFGSGGS
jgi:hypothetical protein